MGREKQMAPAGVPGPVRSAIAFIMAAFSPVLDTMKIISFSSARDTPKNLLARFAPVPFACKTVPPPAPAARAASMTGSVCPSLRMVTINS